MLLERKVNEYVTKSTKAKKVQHKKITMLQVPNFLLRLADRQIERVFINSFFLFLSLPKTMCIDGGDVFIITLNSL